MNARVLGKNGNVNRGGVFKTTSKLSVTINVNAFFNIKLYKFLVETWRPGPSKVACPLCGKEDRPCIRKQRNKVS